MFLDKDDLTLQRMEDNRQKPRWFLYGAIAVIILAPIAAWLVKHHSTQPEQPQPEAPAAAAQTNRPPASQPKQQMPTAPRQADIPAKPQPPLATALNTKPNPPPGADSGQASLAGFRALLAEKRHEEARAMAYKTLATSKDAAAIAETEQLLGALNMAMLFSPEPMPEKIEYTILKGDSLDRIAKKFGTTIDLLRAGNNIKGDRINLSDRIRVFNGTCSLQISKSKNDMVLLINDRFFKRYKVGTGKYGKTPVGIYVVETKIKDPPWTRPSDKKTLPFGDPENVLGTRWMSIRAVENTEPVDGYGIHGTIEPDTVGKQSSDGCIRLVNSDVEEVYAIVPEGTRVIITE